MSGKIFVNYRRDDSASQALNVAQYLEREFGAPNVFLDIDRMSAGQKFPKVLSERLSVSKVMVVVIGPSWLTVKNEEGRRRLDDPEDWVRQEIAHALERGIPLIPLLVNGATLPKKSDLPDDLKPVIEHQVAMLTTAGFRNEMAGLGRDIRILLGIRPPYWAYASAAVALVALVAGVAVIAANLASDGSNRSDPMTAVAVPDPAIEEAARAAERDRIRQAAAADEAAKAAERERVRQEADEIARKRVAELQEQWERDKAARDAQAGAEVRRGAAVDPAPAITSDLFDLDLLHPKVKTVVSQARSNSRTAERRANEARTRAEEARDVASRAGKDSGTWGGLIDGGLGWYKGQLQSNKYHGLGTFLFAKGDEKGNDYAGEFAVGKYDGLGVIAYATNPNNSGEVSFYEGEFTRGSYSGYGIFTWKNGSIYSGSVDDTGKSGNGITKWSDGSRYEGEYVNNLRQGIGVVWNADGTIRFTGRWNKDDFAEGITK